MKKRGGIKMLSIIMSFMMLFSMLPGNLVYAMEDTEIVGDSENDVIEEIIDDVIIDEDENKSKEEIKSEDEVNPEDEIADEEELPLEEEEIIPLEEAELVEEEEEEDNSFFKTSTNLNSNVNSTKLADDAYNSNKEGLVTSVKDQDKFGLCWAFSTMSNCETAMIKAGLASRNVDYSERALAYYRMQPDLYDALGNTKGDKTFSTSQTKYDGGDPRFEAWMLCNWFGPVDEKYVPYSWLDENGLPSNGEYVDDYDQLAEDLKYGSTGAHIMGCRYGTDKLPKTTDGVIDPKNDSVIKNMKAAILEHGSITISYYSGGSLNEGTCGNCWNPEEKISNHAVTAVGWDDNYSNENFSFDIDGDGVVESEEKPKGNGAWIIKNSWSGDHCDAGYIYIVL